MVDIGLSQCGHMPFTMPKNRMRYTGPSDIRIRRLRRNNEQGSVGEPRRTEASNGSVSRTGRKEPAQTRPQTQGQARRFPRRETNLESRFFLRSVLASQFRVSQPLANHLRHGFIEPLRVGHVATVVEPKSLFVHV